MRHVELPLARVRVRERGEGPVIVMTPDCPSVIEHYVGLQDRLAKEGRRVIIFDLPGFGFSTPKRGYDYGLAHGAEIVRGVMDALEVERATLAFSCANGFYAIAAARRDPSRVGRLFLAQTPSASDMRGWADRMVPRLLRVPRVGQAIMKLGKRPAARHWYRMAVARDRSPEPFQAIADRALVDGADYRLADMVQGLGATSDADLDGVTVPTTVLWGERDRSHRPTPADSLLRHAPNAEIVRFAEAGHFPDLELPERYAPLLLEATA
jgi:pimeloyl-ACP methyl ester carboxylesterase